MSDFKIRTTRPTGAEAAWSGQDPFSRNGYGMPNCTTAAWCRAWEVLGTRPKLSTGNAEDWWGNTSDGYQRGQAPRAGAIACWRKGQAGNNADGAGHVAFVERVNADGSILTSESGWKSASYWWTQTRYPGGGNWGMGADYTFQGFIYLPVSGTAASAGTAQAAEKAKPVSNVSQLPVLAYGSTGDVVQVLQVVLAAKGYDVGKADGIFGGKTKAAAAALQKKYGLNADGVVGAATWPYVLGLAK